MSNEPELDAMSKVFAALQPLDEAARARVLRWAAEKLNVAGAVDLGAKSAGGSQQAAGPAQMPGMGPSSPASIWLKQNGVTPDDIEAVFHFNGSQAELIAAQVPGKSNRERTLNTYILAGVRALLSTGDPTFSDKEARALCETLGCLDPPNHAKYLNEKGNEFTGSKEKGWTLTAPGRKRGAVVLKETAALAQS